MLKFNQRPPQKPDDIQLMVSARLAVTNLSLIEREGSAQAYAYGRAIGSSLLGGFDDELPSTVERESFEAVLGLDTPATWGMKEDEHVAFRRGFHRAIYDEFEARAEADRLPRVGVTTV